MELQSIADTVQNRRKVNLLRPSDEYSIQWLAWSRALSAAFFTFYATLVIVAQTEEFWKYLTNLTYITNFLAFAMLFLLHY